MNAPKSEPLMKLVPIMKLMGNSIVSSIKKLTFDFFELFWIPINRTKKKLIFRVTLNIDFLNARIILFFNPHVNYKSNFLLDRSFLPNI